MPGVIANGYGHKEMGAAQHYLDGVALPANPQVGAGINLNDLGFTRVIHHARVFQRNV